MGGAAAAAGSVFRNVALRRVGSAYALFTASEYGAWICILVWAYEHGGAPAAGLIAGVQLVPAAAAAPLLMTIADGLESLRSKTTVCSADT